MGTFVKICGIASGRDAEMVCDLGPDAIGFVFWEESSRRVNPEDVKSWVAGLPGEILKVGVFVDAELERVRRLAEMIPLDVVQLHGRESAQYCAALELRAWKALHLRGAVRRRAAGYHVDAFLIDSYSTRAPGGTGRVGDWEAARRFVEWSSRPVILAGGLDPQNVSAAIRAVGPWGVDVSSGVEASPGRKDAGRVKEFIEACRAED